MKEKLKKFFSKDNLFILICTFLIAIFVFLCVFYYNKDVENYESKNESNINLVEDQNNLNKSWSIDNNGNLVGNNLYNGTLTRTSAGTAYYGTLSHFFDFVLNNVYSIGFLNIGTSAISVELRNGSNSLDFVVVEPSEYKGFSFTASNLDYILNIYFADANTIYPYICYGSTLLPYEPYGVWYSQNNYDNLESQLDIISRNINSLSAHNISSNTLILNSIDVTSQLGGSIFLSDLNGGIGFYNTDFDSYSSFNSSGVNEFNLVSIFNNTYTVFGCTAFVSFSHSAEDYLDISFYRDNQLILSLNDLDSETTQEYMQSYSNQEIQFNKIIISGRYSPTLNDRQGKNYIIDNNNYAFGYQQGYKDSEMFYDSENTRLVAENSQLTNDFNNLNNNYNSLNSNYQSLLSQYNDLANNEYTFSELFWSISAVPFGVLTSAFNVNVMGFNLALSHNRLVNIYGVIMAYKETF